VQRAPKLVLAMICHDLRAAFVALQREIKSEDVSPERVHPEDATAETSCSPASATALLRCFSKHQG
jgi:hypothetical protein